MSCENCNKLRLKIQRIQKSNSELYQQFRENLLKKIKTNEPYKVYKYFEGILK
jgi:hypothetical protein